MIDNISTMITLSSFNFICFITGAVGVKPIVFTSVGKLRLWIDEILKK
jgi:hypothetical protein